MLYKLWDVGFIKYYIVVKKHTIHLQVNKVIHVKRLAQCQAHSKGSINIRHYYILTAVQNILISKNLQKQYSVFVKRIKILYMLSYAQKKKNLTDTKLWKVVLVVVLV